MPRIDAGLACPYCEAESATNGLYTIPPQPYVLCDSGNPQHTFNDIAVLRQMNPRKLPVKPAVEKVQLNHTSLALNVSTQTAEALRRKFGEGLSANLASVLQACAEPRMTILSTADLERFEERLGADIRGASDLFGRVFAVIEEKKAAQNEVERLLRRSNVKRNDGSAEVELDLGDSLPKAAQMAAESGKDVNEFLSDYVRLSLENDWITVS